MGIAEIFLLPALLLPLLTVWALVDLLSRPGWAWDATGQSRLVWAVVVVFVGLIGPVLYLLMARPSLDRATATPPPPAPAASAMVSQ